MKTIDNELNSSLELYKIYIINYAQKFNAD